MEERNNTTTPAAAKKCCCCSWGPFVAGLAAALALGWWVLPNLMKAEKQQPIAFSHVEHVKKQGMYCEQCHFVRADGTYSGSHDVIISDIAICTTTGQYAAEGASTSFTVTAQGNAQQATSIAIDRLYAVMKVGGIATFIAAVSPESASQAVTWTSSDDAIATVDAAGYVTGKSPGIAVITATTTDGSNLKAQAVAIVEKNIVKGDVNDDGKVNITDVNETISIILNK